MRHTTTVRVFKATADLLRRLAEEDGTTINDEVTALVRAERQRRIGKALAQVPLDTDDKAWLSLGAGTVTEHARG